MDSELDLESAPDVGERRVQLKDLVKHGGTQSEKKRRGKASRASILLSTSTVSTSLGRVPASRLMSQEKAKLVKSKCLASTFSTASGSTFSTASGSTFSTASATGSCSEVPYKSYDAETPIVSTTSAASYLSTTSCAASTSSVTPCSTSTANHLNFFVNIENTNLHELKSELTSSSVTSTFVPTTLHAFGDLDFHDETLGGASIGHGVGIGEALGGASIGNEVALGGTNTASMGHSIGIGGMSKRQRCRHRKRTAVSGNIIEQIQNIPVSHDHVEGIGGEIGSEERVSERIVESMGGERCLGEHVSERIVEQIQCTTKLIIPARGGSLASSPGMNTPTTMPTDDHAHDTRPPTNKDLRSHSMNGGGRLEKEQPGRAAPSSERRPQDGDRQSPCSRELYGGATLPGTKSELTGSRPSCREEQLVHRRPGPLELSSSADSGQVPFQPSMPGRARGAEPCPRNSLHLRRQFPPAASLSVCWVVVLPHRRASATRRTMEQRKRRQSS